MSGAERERERENNTNSLSWADIITRKNEIVKSFNESTLFILFFTIVCYV